MRQCKLAPAFSGTMNAKEEEEFETLSSPLLQAWKQGYNVNLRIKNKLHCQWRHISSYSAGTFTVIWQLVPQREAQLQSTQKIEYQAHIMILHALHNILSTWKWRRKDVWKLACTMTKCCCMLSVFEKQYWVYINGRGTSFLLWNQGSISLYYTQVCMYIYVCT